MKFQFIKWLAILPVAIALSFTLHYPLNMLQAIVTSFGFGFTLATFLCEKDQFPAGTDAGGIDPKQKTPGDQARD